MRYRIQKIHSSQPKPNLSMKPKLSQPNAMSVKNWSLHLLFVFPLSKSGKNKTRTFPHIFMFCTFNMPYFLSVYLHYMWYEVV